MGLRTWLLTAALLFLCGLQPALAYVRIAGDTGGVIGSYIDRYIKLRDSGQPVVIDGLCASACTILLAAVPAHRVCVTPRATLGFHAAWDYAEDGYRHVTNADATRELFMLYPQPVQRWIAMRGGLSPRMIYMRSRELLGLYRPC